jgi:hypothetical protein
MKLNELKAVEDGKRFVIERGDQLGSILKADGGYALDIIKTLFIEHDNLTTPDYKKLMALRLSGKYLGKPYDVYDNVHDFIEDSKNDPIAATVLAPWSERHVGLIIPLITDMIFSVLKDDVPEYFAVQTAADVKSVIFSKTTMAENAMYRKRQGAIDRHGIQYRWVCFTSNL